MPVRMRENHNPAGCFPSEALGCILSVAQQLETVISVHARLTHGEKEEYGYKRPAVSG